MQFTCFLYQKGKYNHCVISWMQEIECLVAWLWLWGINIWYTKLGRFSPKMIRFKGSFVDFEREKFGPFLSWFVAFLQWQKRLGYNVRPGDNGRGLPFIFPKSQAANASWRLDHNYIHAVYMFPLSEKTSFVTYQYWLMSTAF